MAETSNTSSQKNLINLAPVMFLLMWSSGAVIAKLGLMHASVWTFLTVRSAISLFLILVVLKIMHGRWLARLTHTDRSTRGYLVAAGLLVQAGYLSGYFLALDSGLSPGIVTVILGLQPLLTPLLTRQTQSPIALLCLAGGFSGLCLAVAGSAVPEEGHLNGFGIACALMALLAITVGTISQTRIRLELLDSIACQNGLALVVFGFIQVYQPWQITWNLPLIGSLLWMSVVVSTGALLLLMLMLKQRTATQVSVLFYAIPALTILLDFVIFNTSLSAVSAAGVALVAVSVWGYQRHQARRRALAHHTA